MFALMRNIHLGLGLAFVLMAMVFAASSLVIMYRPWLNTAPEKSTMTVQLSEAGKANPRSAAMELMADHGLAGDLQGIQQEDGNVRFRIVRPGEAAVVSYPVSTGQAQIELTRQGALETLVQLHTNHGFWHEYAPSNLWAIIAFLASAGLLLLGATGIYLWFSHHSERLIGALLLSFGLIFGITTLVLTRLQQ